MTNTEKCLKVKVLKQIPTIIATNKPLIKAFETYFLLKYHYSNGIISNFSKNQKSVAEVCNISVRTLWTRLKILKENNLITVTGSNIKFSSWDFLCEKFNIRKNFYYIKLNNSNNDGILKLEYLIRLKALQEAKKRMQYAFKAKVKQSSDVYNEFCCITGAENGKLSRRAVLNSAIECFKNPAMFTPDEQFFLLNCFNADDNMNCLTIARMFNNNSASSGTYLKRILEKSGLIEIEKRIIESIERCRKAIMGTVFYSRPTKQTILIMPDNLIIAGL
ncbi:MAG: hypothetical protein WC223_10620 [Bacteroidales bacterium]|jgi:hypothetical protein